MMVGAVPFASQWRAEPVFTRFGEHKLARRLLASLRPGIPLLVGRNFAGHEL
jgi:hypothetical protein